MEVKTRYTMQDVRHYWVHQHLKSTKPGFIVLKMTGACNMRCDYCYSSAGQSAEVMDPDLAVALMDQVAHDNGSPINCCFHGGEPLLCLDQIESILEQLSQRYYFPRLTFNLQTNGLLLRHQRSLDLLKKYDIRPGISLDACSELNDCHRRDVSGNGTFHRVLEGITALQENHIPFGLLAVITKTNVEHLLEFVQWCDRRDIHQISFSIFYPSGYGKDHDFVAPQDVMAAEFQRIIDWLIEQNASRPVDRRFYIREIESLFRNVAYPGNGFFMCDSIPCGAGTRHIGMETNGDIEVCDSFHGYPDYVIGNIRQQSLEEILQHPLIRKFAEDRASNKPECQRCEWNRSCNTGCPARNIAFYGEEGWKRPSLYCEFQKSLFVYAAELLSKGVDLDLLCRKKPRGERQQYGTEREIAK